ncbi:META domain-containing protein [Sedimentitalea sp. HM32M-2]|uniref:META domain-containing protein n=1 Tax=Sedimentitalea sp. HM32M-2 TaxID=3351566 RepID=UPI00364554E9
MNWYPALLSPTAAALCLTATLSAAPVVAQTGDTAHVTTVTGQIAYPQRIALPPGSIARVRVSDVSRADAAASVVAETEIAGQQVPIAFRLSLPADRLNRHRGYGLSASIHDAQGRLRWISDTAIPIDPAQAEIDLGVVMLVQVGADAHADGDTAGISGAPLDTRLTGGVWRISEIDGQDVPEDAAMTLQFQPQGTLSGSGGCNRFSGRYVLSGSMLQFGPLATTQMACAPQIAHREQTLFAILDAGVTVQITDDGTLVLHGDKGQRLVARR